MAAIFAFLGLLANLPLLPHSYLKIQENIQPWTRQQRLIISASKQKNFQIMAILE